jgi:hypothetical protein
MDTNEHMSIEIACKILDIDYLQVSNLTNDQLKKKYHKLALQYHPDKNGNTLETKEYFQKINEAYHYLDSLLESNPKSNSFVRTNSLEMNNYIHILSSFISSIIKCENNYEDIISSIIQSIVTGCKDISLKLFEGVTKDNSLEIYNFLCKYKNILYINEDIIKQVRDVIISKYKDDKIFIVNPSMDDLFENNIYKLIIDEEMFLVPLWHNELYFDAHGNEVIVFCVPELPENVSIDENNNLLVRIELASKDFWNILNDSVINIVLGKKGFTINVSSLYLKKTQKYVFRKQGISKIQEKDPYDIKEKSDILITISFVE